MIFYVVPCSDAKATQPAKARHLYQGPMFAHSLRAAERSAAGDWAKLGRPARVMILSAKFGLVDPEQVLEPYDTKMGDEGSIIGAELTRQAESLGIDWLSDVYALLPRAYYVQLDTALRPLDAYALDVYEVNSGIGDQRRICNLISV